MSAALYRPLPLLLLRSSSEGSESLALEDDFDLLRLRELGTRLFLSRSLEREESELELEPLEESELEPEDESESESESESELESEERFAFFLDFDLPLPLSISFSLSFSLASKIRFAVPVLLLNSSGTSTDGFPSALNFASTPGFSSCCVRDGRETYGRVDLHS